MNISICMAESLHCSPQTITALLIVYTPIQNVFDVLKKKSSPPCAWIFSSRLHECVSLQGCHNKLLQTGQLTQQKCSSGGQKSKTMMPSGLFVVRQASLPGLQIAVFSHGLCSGRLHPQTLTEPLLLPYRLYLQINTLGVRDELGVWVGTIQSITVSIGKVLKGDPQAVNIDQC